MPSERSPLSKRRKLLFALLASLLVLGGAELALRLAFPVARTATLPDGMIRVHMNVAGFRYDPDLYWYWQFLPSPGMQINEHGFRRTRPMRAKKPTGIKRAVVLGDSQTLGAGVGPEETFSAVAERELGAEWEVLNAGISGYRSLNVYRLLQRRILRFEPDVLVIDCMPFDSPRDDGPIQKAPMQSGLLKQVLWHSKIYYLLRHGVEKGRADRSRWLDVDGGFEPQNIGNHGNHDLIAAWAAEHGIKVLFMEYPVTNEQWYLGCHTDPGELPTDVPQVPACQALMKSGNTGRDLFLDRNHMTVLGNEVVGQAVAASIGELF
jgi:lysophospholipase L1-like esterase